MKKVKVLGKNNKHKVFMYALSTCAWCRLAKNFLKDNDVEYEYVDVDLSSREDRERIRGDILERGGRLSYPVIIIDDKKLINGFRKEEIREALEI
jgi:glutaredoxin-like protein NrdH